MMAEIPAMVLQEYEDRISHLRQQLADREAAIAQAQKAYANLQDAALQAFGALVGARPATDSVQGRALERLRPFVI
jgi:hypothetical protein